MQLYAKNSLEWNNIWRALNRPEGYVIGEYTMSKTQETYRLCKTANRDRTYPLVINMGQTNFCCGVIQLGAFYELPISMQMVPEPVLDEFMKVLATSAKRSYNKGILQAWFYKPSHKKEYEHGQIRNLFIKHGFRKIGRETYNPNSGNRIQGFQLSLRKAD